jgi:penicillin-binding protein 1A
VAGGKTGTSQQSRDAWFVGYTAHYVAGVWVGNDDNSKMKDVTGGTVPARLWHDIMSYAHRGKPVVPLPGTRMPTLEQANAKVPWTGSTSHPEPETPFFDRVFGAFGGG